VVRHPRLQEPATTAAAVVGAAVGLHVDEVLVADERAHDEAHVVGHRVAVGLAHDHARVLDGELDAARVPPRIDRQPAFADPLRVIGDQAFHPEVRVQAETLHALPHRVVAVAAFGVEPDRTAQIVDGIDPLGDHLAPGRLVAGEHAEVLGRPAFGGIGPVGADEVQDLPQRHHLVGLAHRLARVLVDEEVRAALVHRRLQLLEAGLRGPHFLQHVVDDENKVVRRHAHRTGGSAALRQLARAGDARGLLVLRPVPTCQEHELRNIDVHRADVFATLAERAAPDPARGRQLFIHPEQGHPDELAGVHVLQARGRAARRTQPAGQAGIEIGARWQQPLRRFLEVEDACGAVGHGGLRVRAVCRGGLYGVPCGHSTLPILFTASVISRASPSQ
jgi:hypothetical protein